MLDAAIMADLRHIAEQHRKYGAPNPQETAEDLINYVLSAIVDGYRRPGSWEACLLEPMGLIPYAEDPWAEEPEEEELNDEEKEHVGYERPLPSRGEYGSRTHLMAKFGVWGKMREPFFSGDWQKPRASFSTLSSQPRLRTQQANNHSKAWNRFCKAHPAEAAFMTRRPHWKWVVNRCDQ